MKALFIGEVLQGILLGIYSTEPQRSKAMDILLAVRNYYETRVEPNTDGTLLHADTWSIIKRECDKFIEADEAYHNARVEAGRRGGLAKSSNAKQNLAKPSNATNSLAKSSKSKQTLALEKEKEKNKNNKYITNGMIVNDQRISHVRTHEEEAIIGRSIEDNHSISRKNFPKKKSLAGMDYYPDPVDHAMQITKQTSAQARKTYGKLLKQVGEENFSAICRIFEAEIRDGEVPNNLGATLTARLKVMIP